MKRRYLEVTFRRGRPFAAYLYLPRDTGVKSARTEKLADGLLVDYAADGTPIGLEILDPARSELTEINRVLGSLGLDPVDADEIAPLAAA
jgi:hypothetical protein